jgi:cation:H+ antiporter
LLLELTLFAISLVAVTLGADWLVTSASRLAEKLGLSPLVVGLTIVAFGTSAPELVVSATAAWRGQAGLAIGNVMGSTVANVGLIVGIAALTRPIAVHRRVLRRESPLLIFVLALVMVLSFNHALGRLDGLVLVTGFSFYMAFLLRWGIEEGNNNGHAGAASGAAGGRPRADRASVIWNAVRILVGLAALLIGGRGLVDSATAIARAYHVPEEVIGATLLAIGTSLPELASTLAAAVRGLGDIAIGNVVGSNVFNLGFVLGVSAIVGDLQLTPSTVIRQVVPALIFCIVLIPLAWTGGRVNRWEGAILLAGYLGFISWVIQVSGVPAIAGG